MADGYAGNAQCAGQTEQIKNYKYAGQPEQIKGDCIIGGCADAQRTIRATVEVRATLGFPSALAEVLNMGKRATRADWGEGQYIFAPSKYVSPAHTPFLCLNAHGKTVPWTPNQMDLFAGDWAVLP